MELITNDKTGFAKVLLYAAPGNGKTRTAATAAWDDRMAPALHIDFGGNTLSTRSYEVQPTIIRADVLSDLNMIYDYLAKGQSANHRLVTQFGMKHEVFKTIILDGVSDMQRASMDLSTGQATLGPGDLPGMVQIQHGQAVLAQMTTIAYRFFKLPMHVIVTALEKDTSGEDDPPYYHIMLRGQAVGMVSGYALLVGRMTAAGAIDKMLVREMQKFDSKLQLRTLDVVMFTQQLGRFYAKDQYGLSIPFIVNPTMGQILDKIEAVQGTTKVRK